jgi:hypothetical protein
MDTQRMDLFYAERGGRPTPERFAAYRKDKWAGGTILRVLCNAGDNECKRQYVYGLYDKQTGRLMDTSTNEVIANVDKQFPTASEPLTYVACNIIVTYDVACNLTGGSNGNNTRQCTSSKAP